jgi:HSP20 family protein
MLGIQFEYCNEIRRLNMKLPVKKQGSGSHHWFGSAAPLLELRRGIESLFDSSFQDIFQPKKWGAELFTHEFLNPKTDIIETDEKFELNIEMPGVSEDNINVMLTNGILTIEAEKEHAEEEKGRQYHRMERSYGMFRRSFHLLDYMDAEAVEASYKNGILKVSVPKTGSSAEVKKIPLKT